tara:strand:- start:22806 stop:23711 length:906 start_codon:yes stop_codon:yes gene_type:complete
MTKKPSRSMQKFLERRKKENEENAIDYILLSENEEFKQAFVIIDRRNTGREIKLLEHKNRNTHTDIQNFIYDFLENNATAHDLDITIIGAFSRDKKFHKYCEDNNIDVVTDFSLSKPTLRHYNTIGKKAIQEKRKLLLKELKNYKENVMLYTDGSEHGKNIGYGCIVDYASRKEPVRLSEGMKKSDNGYLHFEINPIILGLKHVVDNPELKDKKIIITMDSDYANEVISKIKEDKDLQNQYSELYELMKEVDFNIQTNVIKSHKNKIANTKVNIDFRFNKEVDELASQARLKIQHKKRLSI